MDSKGEIEEQLVNHFEDIMTEDRGDRRQDINNTTRLIPRVITRENNEMLVKPISMQGVEEAAN